MKYCTQQNQITYLPYKGLSDEAYTVSSLVFLQTTRNTNLVKWLPWKYISGEYCPTKFDVNPSYFVLNYAALPYMLTEYISDVSTKNL